MTRDEPLAQAFDLDEHLARQLGRLDDAFLWSEHARAVRGGWAVRFRGIDRRPFDVHREWLDANVINELDLDGCSWLRPEQVEWARDLLRRSRRPLKTESARSESVTSAASAQSPGLSAEDVTGSLGIDSIGG